MGRVCKRCWKRGDEHGVRDAEHRYRLRHRAGWEAVPGQAVPLLGNWDTISLIPAVRSAIAATTAVGRYLLLEQPSDSQHPSECLPSQVSYQNWRADAGVNAKHVFEAKRLQDPVAVEVIDRAIYYMALGLVNVIHSFNPDRIVIGGV